MNKLKTATPSYLQRIIQTPEEQAKDTIEALKEWTKVQAIENWIDRNDYPHINISNWANKRYFWDNVPKEYHPNRYLDYRRSILEKLSVKGIVLELKTVGQGFLAKDIEQDVDNLIKAICKCDTFIEDTNPLHLPNLTMIGYAGSLVRNLQKALQVLDKEQTEAADKLKADSGKNGAKEKLKQKHIPRGHIGSQAIINSTVKELKDKLHLPVQENDDKHKIPRSTLEHWQERDNVLGGELEGKIKYDPKTHEVQYPKKWLKKRLKKYKPRAYKP